MINKEYYKEMEKRNRLIPIRKDGFLKGIITFYVGDDDNKYIRNDPWTVLDDEPKTGKTIYIDQLITNHHKENTKCAIKVWSHLKGYFKMRFPQIEQIKWARKGRLRKYVYAKDTIECGV